MQHWLQVQQRKERNEMTSLLDRPITAAGCQAVADTRESIEIKFDLHNK